MLNGDGNENGIKKIALISKNQLCTVHLQRETSSLRDL